MVDLKGIDLRCGAGRVAALRRPRRLIHSRSRSIPPENIPNKRATPSGWLSYLVDLKGIEPSNLTDANRALSQLSYKPISFFPGPLFESLMYYITEFLFVKKNIDYLFALRYNICVTFDKAVLVGEPAVPCRLQSATAGMNPRSRKFSVSSDSGKQ